MGSSVPPMKQILAQMAKEQERRARVFARLAARTNDPDMRAWAEHERRLSESARALSAGIRF